MTEPLDLDAYEAWLQLGHNVSRVGTRRLIARCRELEAEVERLRDLAAALEAEMAR